MIAAMNTETFGRRLRAARKRVDLTMEQLGGLLGVSPQAVYAWEIDKHKPKHERLIILARSTKVDLLWLIAGVGEIDPLNYSDIGPGEGRVVPRLGTEAMALHTDLQDTYEMAMAHFSCGPNSYAVSISDRSNSPRFEVGDSVIIDPDLRPEPGDMVLVDVDKRSIFRRYTLRGLGVNGGDIVELVALNPDYVTQTVEIGSGATILGTMSEHTKPRRL